MTLEECRRFYAEEIRYAANLSTPALIEAFARVPRENFLGPGPWKIAGADLTGGGAIYIPTEDDAPRHDHRANVRTERLRRGKRSLSRVSGSCSRKPSLLLEHKRACR